MTRRTRWLALVAGALILLLAGRMGLRYLDYRASEADRPQAGAPPG